MIMLHGWAVVLTARWLASGEAAVWELVRRFGDRLTGLVFGRSAYGLAPLCVVGPTEPGAPRPAVLRHGLRLRGPPRHSLAALG